MTALADANRHHPTAQVGRAYALSVSATQVTHALVEVGDEVTVHSGRARLIPRSGRTVPAFLQEQVLDILTEVDTAAIDVVALVTNGPAAPWTAHLHRRFPALPLTITHPVLAATWAEYHRRGQTGTLAHITVGHTIQAAFVLDGRLHPSSYGHIPIDPHSTQRCDTCGTPGCLTALAAAPAVPRRYQDLRAAAPRGQRAGSPDRGGPSTLPDLAHAAARGDNTAAQAFRDTGHTLGIGLAILVHLLAPNVITIGGGLPALTTRSTDAGGYFAAVERTAHMHTAPTTDNTVITLSPHGNELLGAALLALRS